MIRHFAIVLAAAAAILSASGAASAGDYRVRHVDVAYGDLNLAAPAGRAALDARIEAAAIMACGGNPVFAPSYRDAPNFYKRAFEDCRAQARRQAVSELQRHGVRLASR